MENIKEKSFIKKFFLFFILCFCFVCIPEADGGQRFFDCPYDVEEVEKITEDFINWAELSNSSVLEMSFDDLNTSLEKVKDILKSKSQCLSRLEIPTFEKWKEVLEELKAKMSRWAALKKLLKSLPEKLDKYSLYILGGALVTVLAVSGVKNKKEIQKFLVRNWGKSPFENFWKKLKKLFDTFSGTDAPQESYSMLPKKFLSSFFTRTKNFNGIWNFMSPFIERIKDSAPELLKDRSSLKRMLLLGDQSQLNELISALSSSIEGSTAVLQTHLNAVIEMLAQLPQINLWGQIDYLFRSGLESNKDLKEYLITLLGNFVVLLSNIRKILSEIDMKQNVLVTNAFLADKDLENFMKKIINFVSSLDTQEYSAKELLNIIKEINGWFGDSKTFRYILDNSGVNFTSYLIGLPQVLEDIVKFLFDPAEQNE